MIPAKWHAGTSIFRELAQSVGQRSLPHSRGQNPDSRPQDRLPNQVPMDATFCIEALTGALARHGNDIFNTDQGSQFTGPRNGAANPRSSSREILKNIHRIIIIHSQIPFPANSNQYRFNIEFLINQKL
jgi:hypothetical protein